MAEHFNVVEQFGIDVFNEETMKQRLPKNVFKALKKTIAEGKELDSSIADVVASAMKDWAIEKGATHYTHWFQPMTGITAEKHDSFISPMGDGTTASFRPAAAVRSLWSFPARSSSRVSRMHPPSRQAACALPSRQEAIPHGILPPMHS